MSQMKRTRCSASVARGRYVSDSFRDCFALECEAVKRVRNDMGLTNVEIMIPFVRTVDQAESGG
ncbi:phosphoenolpyruvate synthase [Escherichia coli]|nr:phosphoenolpyruvate synthase [Escherichia coli]